MTQTTLRRILLLAFVALPWFASGQPQRPAGKALRLRIYPQRIHLGSAIERERVIVVAEYHGALTGDVTGEARLAFEKAGIATLDENSVLAPRANGRTWLIATLGPLQARIPVQVENAGTTPPVSFQNDVLPVLTRAGCNAGSCHGNAAGKNGFGLSLFGYDMNADHRALTRELRGRRVNPADPTDSLMLKKPSRRVQHGGGKRLLEGSPGYQVVQRWIARGAPNDVDKAPKLTGISVLPPQAVMMGKDQRQQLCVRANYADGSDRDVTDLAILSSSNEGAATVDDLGLVTSGAAGEAYIMARFGDFAVVSQVLVLDASSHDFAWQPIKANNYIDEAIHQKLRKMRIQPAPVCDDATFGRRIYIDVLDVLPTAAETRQFLADQRPDKRARLVDELLARPGFSDVWAMQWAEVLRIESRRLERKGMHVYTEFLRDAFRRDVPFDKVVHQLLTANGPAFSSPAANFYLVTRNPREIAENVAQNFFGIRIQCAQCHNHPFERWTLDDYYGFAAFFARIGYKRSEHPYEFVVFPRTNGEIRSRRTNQVARPKFLGGKTPQIPRTADRRRVLADWITSKDNPYFARNVANRVFARFFGRGIVDPVDDVRVSNPPSHPGLYEQLANKIVEYRFDIRRLIRDIVASRSYQLSPSPSLPAAAFACAPTRRLTAEQLLTAIDQVTGVPSKFRGLPLGARPSGIEDGTPGNRFLDIFGRPRRTSACTCDRRSEPTLTQVLHLINGNTISGKLRRPNGRLRQLLARKTPPDKIVEELYLVAYSRPPTAAEADRLLESMDSAMTAAAWEDVFWAVLNSQEFVFNH